MGEQGVLRRDMLQWCKESSERSSTGVMWDGGWAARFAVECLFAGSMSLCALGICTRIIRLFPRC